MQPGASMTPSASCPCCWADGEIACSARHAAQHRRTHYRVVYNTLHNPVVYVCSLVSFPFLFLSFSQPISTRQSCNFAAAEGRHLSWAIISPKSAANLEFPALPRHHASFRALTSFDSVRIKQDQPKPSRFILSSASQKAPCSLRCFFTGLKRRTNRPSQSTSQSVSQFVIRTVGSPTLPEAQPINQPASQTERRIWTRTEKGGS
jgi:hypothetical protein